MPERYLDLPALRRLAPVRSYDKAQRTFEAVWSAGARVLRFDWWEGEYFIEELDMSGGAVDLTRLNAGAPLLNNHGRGDLTDVVGVVERAWLDGSQGLAQLRLSSREDVAPIAGDVADGIIRNLSVGYNVLEMQQDGFDEQTGYPIMRVTRWEPFELSLVPVGADAAAQVRNANPEQRNRCLIRVQPADSANSQESIMPDAAASAAGQAAETAAAAATIETARNEAAESERARTRGILAVGEQFGYQTDAMRFINEGKTEREFRDHVLEEIRKKNGAAAAATRDIGLQDREVRNYSLTRAIRAMVNQATGSANPWKEAGFERECHEAAMRQMGIEQAGHGGIYVPHDVQARLMMPVNVRRALHNDRGFVDGLLRQIMQRDLTVATASAGGYLVATQNLAASFIELLRARAKVVQLGAMVMSGLRDSITVPKQTGAATGYWLTNEATAITESNLTFGQLALSPKNVGAYVEISRQLLLQSSPAADLVVMNDINRVLSLAVDKAALNGAGSGGEPTGVLNTAGIGAFTGTSLAWAAILNAEADVANANADVETMAYLTTPSVRELLKARGKQTSGVEGNFIWGGVTGDNMVNGYRAEVSTQVPSATMIFGDFAQIVIAEWGELEIALNPYANFTAGITGVRGWATIDIGVRQAGAYSAASSIT